MSLGGKKRMIMSNFNQQIFEKYITDEIEESLTLEYKSADALAKSDRMKKEITKDVSAMANSAGGKIIYGIKEYDETSKRHLPERLDPIDRSKYSKEWLEHIINNIKPRISNLIIHPVDIVGSSKSVIYVIEIPQSSTAHQSKDLRYYKRYNFESVPMEDFEIRDVMHRATAPNVIPKFDYKSLHTSSDLHRYQLQVKILNKGIQLVNYFKLDFTFLRIMKPKKTYFDDSENLKLRYDKKNNEDIISYYSKRVLFPEEEFDLTHLINYRYEVDNSSYTQIDQMHEKGMELNIKWTLYADNMPPKNGKISCFELHEF